VKGIGRFCGSCYHPGPIQWNSPVVSLSLRAVAAAERYSNAPERSVVLLLLPHSVELFLLHIGLVLTGRVPAILAWPTGRVDPRKYSGISGISCAIFRLLNY